MLIIRINKILIFMFFLWCNAFSQNKEALKQQKLDIQKEIEYTKILLKKNEKNKEKTFSYFKILEKQIKNKETLLNALNIESSYLISQIQKTKELIQSLETEIEIEIKNLKTLEKEYAKMILASFKKKGGISDWVFIVSSERFNQAYKRMIYLKQYSISRRNQAERIVSSKFRLNQRKEELKNQQAHLQKELLVKQDLKKIQKAETEEIVQNKKEKTLLIRKLKKLEKKYQTNLENQQKRAKELEQKIREIIKEEIRVLREKEGKTGLSLTPSAVKLSNKFQQNKGKLPWPTPKGIIVRNYGKQKHKMFSEIETFNNGIDIATEKNTEVRAVFDGFVSRIFFIKGEGKAILINHGEYFTVYSGLKDVVVKQGEEVLLNEKIGVVFTKEQEEITELHFEIWQGYNKKDPSTWLLNAD